LSKDAGAYPGGSGPPPKKFELQREHGSKCFGGDPDPPGYAHVKMDGMMKKKWK